MEGWAAYIKINDFGEQGGYHEYKQNVEKPLLELRTVIATNLGNDGSTETLGGDDTEASNHTADRDVDHHALLSVLGAQPEGDYGGGDDDHAGVAEKAGGYDELLHVLDVGDGRLFGGIDDDDDGADDAVEAADLTHKTQAFLQENGRQDGAHDDGESAHGGDEDGVDEGVCDEVADLADNHERHSGPPPDIFEVSISLAGLFVVFCVCAEQTVLLQNEGDADEQSRRNGEDDADDLVDWGSGGSVAAHAAGSRIEVMRGGEEVSSRVHATGNMVVVEVVL